MTLYRGDEAAFESRLVELAEVARAHPDPLPSVIQNACLSMSLLAYLQDRAGQTQAARDLALFNAGLYAKSLARMTPDAISFEEAIRAQSAVVAGLRVAERKPGHGFTDPAEILPLLTRATRPTTLAVLTDRMTAYLEARQTAGR